MPTDIKKKSKQVERTAGCVPCHRFTRIKMEFLKLDRIGRVFTEKDVLRRNSAH